ESADGGATWKGVDGAGNQLSLLGVEITADNRALAVGQTGMAMARDASGQWTKLETGSKERLFAVDGNLAGQIVIGGAFGTVLLSTDAGKTFTRLAIDWAAMGTDGAEPHMYAAHIDDQGLITVAGEFGLILRSADAGQTWRKLNQSDASIFALDINPQGQASYAAGQIGTLLRSDDGGETWVVQNSGSTANLLAVESSGQSVMVAGFRESVSSTDGGSSWKVLSSAPFGGVWYAGLAAAGDSVFAVGQSGTVVKLQQ
ncbi:MAG TPA: photosystem II stability/assembly factor-like protein, partial [Rhodocyclaceae bacterium]